MRSENKQLNLMDEINEVTKVLNIYSENADQLVVVKSNHDEFLYRYLDEGLYVKDPQNKRLALQLALAILDLHDPLKFAVETMTPIFSPNKVKWLKRDEELKIAGIELGQHGDLGSNGGPGSVQSLEIAYGNSVSGHTHSSEILRGTYKVATSSILDPFYTKGATSWSHTSCLVYPNGARQLINSIFGMWRGK